MGTSQGKPTFLECMIQDFGKGFSDDYRVRATGCVCVPHSHQRKLICHIWDKVMDSPLSSHHAGLFPCINSWLGLCQNLLPWLHACICQEKETLLVIKDDQLARKSPINGVSSIMTKKIYPIPPDDPDDDFPPYLGNQPDLLGPPLPLPKRRPLSLILQLHLFQLYHVCFVLFLY